ncbi:hypothetical protein ACFZDK_53375 [Streptomyces sp. NPDC007901]|uniref:hypothetical protein n=1 Tax=Streptomyces sp. NPDC007901 TaxID=3364785 RepID=UPI0036EB3A81
MTHRTYESPDVPAWPAYALTVYEDGRVDAEGPLVPAMTHAHRTAAIGTVAEAAARLGRPVRAEATETDGTVWHLVVAPDGTVGELTGGPRAPAPKKRGSRNAAPTVRLAAGAEPEPGMIADSLALVMEQLEAGRLDTAGDLAARLDEQAADTLGVSHPDALRAREVRARVTALRGDTAGSVRLFRDVAERRHYRGESEHAETAAAHAEALWVQIADPETALSIGIGVIRMRNQIPGKDGTALAAVLEHQAWLNSARTTTAPAGPAPGGGWPSPASTPKAGASRAARVWDRPARDPRTAAG